MYNDILVVNLLRFFLYPLTSTLTDQNLFSYRIIQTDACILSFTGTKPNFSRNMIFDFYLFLAVPHICINLWLFATLCFFYNYPKFFSYVSLDASSCKDYLHAYLVRI